MMTKECIRDKVVRKFRAGLVIKQNTWLLTSNTPLTKIALNREASKWPWDPKLMYENLLVVHSSNINFEELCRKTKSYKKSPIELCPKPCRGHRLLMWRKTSTAHHLEHIIPTLKHCGGSRMLCRYLSTARTEKMFKVDRKMSEVKKPLS